MSEQHLLNNIVDDSVNVAQTIEEKPDGNTTSIGRDLKQPVTGELLDLDTKKKSFQITSTVELDHDDFDIDSPVRSYADNVPENTEIVGIEQNSLSRSDGLTTGAQPKKKISFQVTSIESKEGRVRGDSNGYDEEEEELNESEFLEDEAENSDLTLSHASSNGNSRFKVVKIPRYDSKMYTRGRWGCWDFIKPPPSAVPYLNVIPGYNLDLNEKTDFDSHSGGKNSLGSNVSTGGKSSTNIELLSQEGIVEEVTTILAETQIHEGKNPIVNDSVVVVVPKLDERSDLTVNNASGLANISETQPSQAVVENTKLRLDVSEDELVAKKIEQAMNQVVQIKADLLQNVNADVKKLKQTIQQLTQENQRLKEENELLKQKLSSNPTESI